jgi:hypothetical protein
MSGQASKCTVNGNMSAPMIGILIQGKFLQSSQIHLLNSKWGILFVFAQKNINQYKYNCSCCIFDFFSHFERSGKVEIHPSRC